ncbi:MAG: 23S rRNA (uracil(1939)-C(5))-methyltransferase RlmD [Bacilli bacterium]|nr:23S rRNA (uracil(1939)-C(5))-methyltransferase RlmD [Bacilli bacterium]
MDKKSFPLYTHATCVDLSFEGKGVAKNGNDVVFVDGMFPGEEGEIEISYRRNGALFGRVKKLDKVSPNRIQPRCPVCSACGGCCYQQLSYKTQLEYKTKKVKEQFKKIGHMDVSPLPCLGMEDPYNYRNKIQMPFGYDKRHQIVCGFYKQKTHQIIPITECAIEDKRASAILSAIKDLLKGFKLEPYNEDTGYGLLRHVLIRCSHYRSEIMVVLITAYDTFPGRNNFVKELIKRCPEITTIVQNINKRHTNVILGEQERVLYGPGFIKDTLCGIEFRISSKSFYQINPVMTEVLYGEAVKAAQLSKEDVVLDAYSGIGTIGLIASKHCGHVLSVELVPEAVKDAKENAKRNGINNFEVVAADASDYIVELAKNNGKIDVLFMDPPRKGSDERFLNSVKKLKPNRVVYVSCDPSTLARDVAYLSDMYKVKSVQPVDMFPHTFHVESVVLLEK